MEKESKLNHNGAGTANSNLAASASAGGSPSNSNLTGATPTGDFIIRAENITTHYGARLMHDSVSFAVRRGEIYGILGTSGSGKTTLLKTMIFLKRPTSGRVVFDGRDIWAASERERAGLRREFGVAFQFGALFSSMSVFENVAVALRESGHFAEGEVREICAFWLHQVGLAPSAAHLLPSELSGGMKKRVALARALVLSPKVLFLDEPNSGLDPISARGIDALVRRLREVAGVTIVMVTHDEVSIRELLGRFVILDKSRAVFEGDARAAREFAGNPLKEIFV